MEYHAIMKKHVSLVARVKESAPMKETQVWSLGREDPLKKGMATHYSILARRIPWTAEPGGLQSMGSQRIRHDWVTNTFTFSMKKQESISTGGKMDPCHKRHKWIYSALLCISQNPSTSLHAQYQYPSSAHYHLLSVSLLKLPTITLTFSLTFQKYTVCCWNADTSVKFPFATRIKSTLNMV